MTRDEQRLTMAGFRIGPPYQDWVLSYGIHARKLESGWRVWACAAVGHAQTLDGAVVACLDFDAELRRQSRSDSTEKYSEAARELANAWKQANA